MQFLSRENINKIKVLLSTPKSYVLSQMLSGIFKTMHYTHRLQNINNKKPNKISVNLFNHLCYKSAHYAQYYNRQPLTNLDFNVKLAHSTSFIFKIILNIYIGSVKEVRSPFAARTRLNCNSSFSKFGPFYL